MLLFFIMTGTASLLATVIFFARTLSTYAQFSHRPYEDNSEWIGKAYIITSKVHVSTDVIAAAKACGFYPKILPATLPFGHHYGYSKEKLYKTCMGIKGHKLLPYKESAHAASTTLSELSLICSHRHAMQLIADDKTMLDSDWALIMEDDAILNAKLNPEMLRLYTLQAINFARWESEEDQGYIYFGICHGVCMRNISIFLSKDQFSIGKGCFGYCTHAYALTKYTARGLFSNLYNDEILRGHLLQTDQVMVAYFHANSRKGSSVSALVLGKNIVSPDEPMHTGVMYQTNRTRTADGIMPGTALTSNRFRPQTCFIMRVDGDSVAKMLIQYAALVTFCLHRNLLPYYCASFVPTVKRSAKFNVFTHEFGIDAVRCAANNQTVNDVDIMDRIDSKDENELSNFISGAIFGTTFRGSFANLKLFPETNNWLKRYFQSVFLPSPYTRSASDDSSGGEKENFATSVLSWIAGSSSSLSLSDNLPMKYKSKSSEHAASSTPCSPAAVDVCVYVDGKGKPSESEQASLQNFYSSSFKHLSSKYIDGVALHIILDSSVRMALLQGILALTSQYHSRNASSSICVKSLRRFEEDSLLSSPPDILVMHKDIWTIRQLIGCRHILLGRSSIVSVWGAYLSSAEIITSTQVNNPLPEWTIIK